VKELDPNFNDIKLQTSNFIGTKVIDFQKKQKNPKKWFFWGALFLVLEGSQNLDFWCDERT
jgi:hypothetical protein